MRSWVVHVSYSLKFLKGIMQGLGFRVPRVNVRVGLMVQYAAQIKRGR